MQLALNSWESLGQERTAEWRRGRTREIAISAVQDAAEEYFYSRMEDLKNALLRCFRFMPLKQGAKYFMSFDLLQEALYKMSRERDLEISVPTDCPAAGPDIRQQKLLPEAVKYYR